ncbi:protein takeout-like [Neodiprion virginianus]|uniref:Protein takeout n=1 Tax=Neodiprion lecontei TaxID=441921 RepID=A0A6J0CBM4_NEOLC|nr:protein takeout [Neodiprion lecontei]XP_046420898.1 protein takeout-like [Neodiprion fabricii]XP_046616316.1 protein takeout-like [Neodiprion virginianus]
MTRTTFVLVFGFLAAASARDADVSAPLKEPEFLTPEYILPCSRLDPAIDICIQKSLNHLRPYLIRGLPELELPPIEPLTIPELGMQNGQGAVRVSALFKNINAIGPGNFTVSKARADIPNLRIDFHITIPKIELRGRYEVAGNVLLFPIQSQGDFWAVFSEVAAIAQVQGIEEIREGVRYMRISHLMIDFSLGRARFRIVDELNGNNVIGQAMNQFLNENAKEIIEEMRPAASTSIATHFRGFLNKAFTKIPMKVWLHDT